MVPPEVQQRVDQWMNGPIDDTTRQELVRLQQSPQELIDAFFCNLSFGTGGMRGLMGVGTSRINRYTIGIATQGVAHYLIKQGIKDPAIVIGFDSRNHSQELAQDAARVLAGNGIRVYLLDALRPTPYVSFVCRAQKASGALMITASHNPKEYNGYKVYGSDGAQVVAPHDKGIMKEVAQVGSIAQLKCSSWPHPLIEQTPVEFFDARYLAAIAPLHHPNASKAELKIVYTSLHGTGGTLMSRALGSWGFHSIYLVAEQQNPDGNFPTVITPNPEEPQALELGIQQMQRTSSDLLLATDPDADRIGAVVMHQGTPVALDGNQMAALLAEYLCETRPVSVRSAIVTTLVSTELLKKIALQYGVACIEVLTGFKYIAEKIHQWERAGQPYDFLFGAEESYGYLIGTHARDKDAIVTACLIAEMTAYLKAQDQTLIDRLHHLYHRYGVHREKQGSVHFSEGQQGMEQMQRLMQHLRSHPPGKCAGLGIVVVEDYKTQQRLDIQTGNQERLELPVTDMLLLRLEEGSRVIIRPSGTEPKLKIYVSTAAKTPSSIEEGIAACDRHLDRLLASIKKEWLSSL